MDASRSELLSSLASDAALERTDFIVQATAQLKRFLEANAERIDALGGLTLIDDDPDYLSIAPDMTFRSRTRYLDQATGEWVSDTEIIETADELVELYNPADVYASFAEAAREAAGLPPEPTGAEDLLESAHIPAEDSLGIDAAYAAAADDWAAGAAVAAAPDNEEAAARQLYDLALTFQERSQRSEARLLDDFGEVSARLSEKLGDVIVVDDDDERLSLAAGRGFRADVLPEGSEGEWRSLTTPDEIVEFYDPTDVFGDLADALAEAFPSVSPDVDGESGETEGAAASTSSNGEEPGGDAGDGRDPEMRNGDSGDHLPLP